MRLLQGLGVALITPFNEDGSIDFSSLEKLVQYNINGGVDYLVVLGTTGENVTLNSNEKEEVISCIKKSNNKQLPLVLGIGGNNTSEVVKQINSIDLTEFEAILSVSPYYNKPTQEGIYQHYKLIAENSSKPIILYNVPGRTGSNMEASTTVKLAKDFKNIVGIKEACPNFYQFTHIIKDRPEGFLVISGDDEAGTPVITAGGDGLISVIGQALPKETSQMINLALNKKIDEAYKVHYQLQSLINLMFIEGNPAGVKALLSILGVCKPHTRLPLVEASQDLVKKIETELNKLHKLIY